MIRRNFIKLTLAALAGATIAPIPEEDDDEPP